MSEKLSGKYAGSTPGPWKVTANYVYASGLDVGVEKSGTVCACGDMRKSRYVEYTPLEITSPCLEEAHANARLIADAPQLAADNEALRKENAELKSQLEGALSASGSWAGDCDRLTEQVRVLREIVNHEPAPEPDGAFHHCRKCKEGFDLPVGYDPTYYCNACAQELIEKIVDALATAPKSAKEGA